MYSPTKARWARPSKSVQSVEADLKKGAVLRCMFDENGKKYWWLDGARHRRVHAATAEKVIQRPNICALNDGLFGLSQSWVCIDFVDHHTGKVVAA